MQCDITAVYIATTQGKAQAEYLGYNEHNDIHVKARPVYGRS